MSSIGWLFKKMARSKNKLASSKALQSLLIQFQWGKSSVTSNSDTCANHVSLKGRRIYFHWFFCIILLKTSDINLVIVVKPVLDIRKGSQSQVRIVHVHYEFSMAVGRASRWRKGEKREQKVLDDGWYHRYICYGLMLILLLLWQ